MTSSQYLREEIVGLLSVLSMLIPVGIYLLFTAFLYPAPNSGLMMIGLAGAFIIGICLICIPSLLKSIKEGSGGWGIIIAVCGLIGIGATTVSCIVMYVPFIYEQLDETVITYSVVLSIALLFLALWYIFFRISVSQWMQHRGISKTAFKKELKGVKNYWWYEALHKKYNLTIVYWCNKTFTLIFAVISVLSLLLGWWKGAHLITCILFCLLCAISCFMFGFSLIQWHLYEFGKKVPILYNKSGRTKKWMLDSGLLRMVIVVFPILLATMIVKCYLRIQI